jgi:Family of unknown function (DUF6152)
MCGDMVAPRYGERDTESTMKRRAGIVSLVVFGLLAVSIPLFAHHGNASFDTKLTTVTGTVTDYIWSNPHVWLKMDAKDASGNTRCSSVEKSRGKIVSINLESMLDE